jgi:mevalonate kinase
MTQTLIEKNNDIETICNGKLLISGEYFVLDGAKAFALPCKFGQRFSITYQNVEFKSEHILQWKAYTKLNVLWIDAIIDLKSFTLLNDANKEAKMLLDILKVCKTLNTQFLNIDKNIIIEAKLDFPRSWGLGSSSTLIYFIAKWASVNPYELLEKTFGGSGYDIACAGSDSPLLYTRNKNTPVVKEIEFNPSFKNQLYFIHLNHKMNSRNAIQYYKNLKIDKQPIIAEINQLTESFCGATTIEDFEKCIIEHEDLISKTLAIDKVKNTVFNDYWGTVKSLGAWGGDFVLMTNSSREEEEFKKYLHERGFNTILSYDEMILS